MGEEDIWSRLMGATTPEERQALLQDPEFRRAVTQGWTESAGYARTRDTADRQARIDAAKADHDAKMYELRNIGIPDLQIKKMDVQGRLEIARQEQALSAMKTLTDMQSMPENWIKTSSFARGVNSTSVPQWLQMVTGGGLQGFGAGVQGAPGTLGDAGLNGALGKLTGQAPTDMTQANGLIDQIGANPHQYNLAGATDTEQKMLGGALMSRGFDAPTWLTLNKRAGVGQGGFGA